MSSVPVSVIMAVFNREDLVARAVQSILDQDFPNFEFLIVDDGSTDRTQEAIRGFNDPRIRIITLPANVGVAMARNVGLAMARGNFLATMDSDDAATPDRLRKQHEFMLRQPEIDIVGSNILKLGSGAPVELRFSPQDGVIKARLLKLNGSAMIHPATMVRSAFVRKSGVRYPMTRTDSDHGFWIEAMLNGAQFSIVEETLLHYYRHGENLTAESGADYPEHQKRKTRARARLLGHFFPSLSHREAGAVANLMEEGRKHSLGDVHAALMAIRKSASETNSYWGESKEALAEILAVYAHAAEQGLARAARMG